MKTFDRISFLLFLLTYTVSAEVHGSRSFFALTPSLIGIGAFTALIGALLIYACRMDIKHWRKSIDGSAQLGYPRASSVNFQLPLLHENSETEAIPQTTDATRKTESTLIEKATQEERTLRIVKAMYVSSNREIPEVVQKSLQTQGTAQRTHTHRPTTTLHTISEHTEKTNSMTS